jgi:hypothetical protein
VSDQEGSQTFDPPLASAEPGSVLLGLLDLVVAGRLAEGPDVVLVPEEDGVASVRLPVIGNELGGVVLDVAAAALTGEQVALENLGAKALPSRQVVPASPMLQRAAVALVVALAEAEAGRRRREP